VRVLDALVDRALLEPGDAEPARADPAQRVAAELADRDGPVAAAVAARLGEAGGIRPGRGGRGAALGDSGAVGDDRPGDRERDEDRPGARGERRAGVGRARARVERRRERHDREHEREADEPLPLARAERALERPDAGEGRRRGDGQAGRDGRDRGGVGLRAGGTHRDEDDERDRGGGQGAAGEAELDAERERGARGDGRGPQRARSGPVAGDPC
jgi:hypothetical protein